MPRLYDIQKEIYDLLDQIALQEGEVTPEQEEKLDELHASREQKLKNYVRYFRNLDADVDEIDYEVKRLQNRKAQITNGKERLLGHVGRMLGESGYFVDPVAGELKWSKPKGAVELVDNWLNTLPAKYMEAKWQPKTAEINQALQDGEEIPGAKLVFDRRMRYVAPNPNVKVKREHKAKGQ